MSSGSTTTLRAIDAAAWNALLDAQAAPTPFMRHEYLRGAARLAAARSPTPAGRRSFLTRRARRRAASPPAPLYLKSHSYGEYVFDWAWADAYQRHGLRLLPEAARRGAVHAGARLAAAGARRRRARRAAASAMQQLARDAELSSAHLLFLDDADRAALRSAPAGCCAARRAVPLAEPRARALRRLRRLPRQPAARQAQEDPAGAPPRRRGRRQLRRARGRARSTTADWDFFYRCYTLTYRAHHSTPYLTRDFFAAHGARRCPSTG